MLKLLILLVTIASATAEDIEIKTTAFDCGIRRQNDLDIATYSLVDTKKCEVNKNDVNISTFYGQVVQKNKIKYIKVLQCKIKLHRTVHGCSWLGYLVPVENGVQEYLLEITRDQCKKLHDTGYFVYNSNIIISDVKVNTSTTRTLYLAGNAEDRSCNTGTFSDRFGSYSKVLVEGTFVITLSSYTAKLDVENKNIMLTSGLMCEFDRMNCIDIMNGYTFWERLTDENCYKDKLELIYEGNITKITESYENDTTINYVIDNETYLIMLEDKGFIEVCYNKFIRTQSAETYILENHENFLKSKHVTVDYTKYFSNKLTLVYKQLESEIKDIYLKHTKYECENQMSIIKQKLNLAYTSPEQFVFDLMGHGFTGQLAGNLIHIIKCQPVEVKIDPYPKICTQDIPILYHNEPLFMSSTSHIIIKHSQKLNCNKILPVKFRINGNWIKFTPTLRLAKAPRKLGPEPRENYKPVEIRDLENRGLYSKQDIENYQKSINFPHERAAIIDNTAAEIRDIRNIEDMDIEENFFKSYVNKHIGVYWEKYKDFGSISAAIFMTIAIIMIMGYIINIILNALQIKNIVGCSYKMGAALFSSTTHRIIRKAEKNVPKENTGNTYETKEIELEDYSIINPKPKILTPKSEHKLPRFIPIRLTNKKIQTSFRKKKKRSMEVQVDVHGNSE